MEEAVERIEQFSCSQPKTSLYHTLQDHHRTLMEHHRIVQALFQTLLECQHRKHGQEQALHNYSRELNTHHDMVEEHLRLLEEHRQLLEDHHALLARRPLHFVRDRYSDANSLPIETEKRA